MGYQTDYIGYLEIEPPLDEREQVIINRISGSPYLLEEGGPLRVADASDEAIRQVVADAPRGWSNWTVSPDGCCLSYDGGDKANYMVPWLKFLMRALLVPAGRVVNGMVVGSRRDTRELYSITVRDNEVEIELLWPGNPEWSHYPALAYQTEIDSFRQWVKEYKSR